jgi:hypothetical protein
MADLTVIEMDVLKLTKDYGNGLDLRGPRISRTVQGAARELLRKGYLVGKVGGLSLTVEGAALLPHDGKVTP